jgi:hypothetical protein
VDIRTRDTACGQQHQSHDPGNFFQCCHSRPYSAAALRAQCQRTLEDLRPGAR